MIPRAFFDWGAEQWWGAPAFVILVWVTLLVGGTALALARSGTQPTE